MAGKIFLSYRREDTAGFAGRIYDRLEQSFRRENLFMDVDTIGAGRDFVRVIEHHVEACDVMLVLIGRNWLTVADEMGRPRLESPEDFVRVEVELALKFGKRVIPVLVDKTEMPRANALAEPLKELSQRNAVGLTHERFKTDALGLVRVLEEALAEAEEARRQAAAAAEKRRAEEAAKAERAAQLEKERARLEAIAGLTPDQAAKAEEMANWEYIKTNGKVEDFRDHLARFPQGVSERWTRARLEDLVWTALPRSTDVGALKSFLAEFPSGAHANEANAKLAERETQDRTRKAAEPVAGGAQFKRVREEPTAALKLYEIQASHGKLLRISSINAILSVAPFVALMIIGFISAYWEKGRIASPSHLLDIFYFSAYQMFYGAIFAWITVRGKNDTALWLPFYLSNVGIFWIAMGIFKFDPMIVGASFFTDLVSATICTIYIKYWRKKLMT